MRMDILIVEDQRRIAEGLSVMLSSCKEDGKQIERTLIADNGVQALKMLEQQPVDLLITDIRMPIMDGLDAISAIRTAEDEKGRKHVPILALTADGQMDVEQAVRAVGGDGMITKPVDPARLVFLVEEAAAAA